MFHICNGDQLMDHFCKSRRVSPASSIVYIAEQLLELRECDLALLYTCT